MISEDDEPPVDPEDEQLEPAATGIRGGRRRARELAVQALYQAEMIGAVETGGVAYLEREFAAPGTDLDYFRLVIAQVHARRATTDALITEVAANWGLERISLVDRNVLRLAIYELLEEHDLPVKVVINEAIELSKRFGGEQSGRFVNGILDRLARRLRPGQVGGLRNQ